MGSATAQKAKNQDQIENDGLLNLFALPLFIYQESKKWMSLEENTNRLKVK